MKPLFVFFAWIFAAHAQEPQPYRGWEKSLRIENDALEIVVVPATGRLLHLGRKGQPNLLKVPDEVAGKLPPPEEGDWINYGGDWMWPVHQDHWPKLGGPRWPPLRVLDQAWQGEASRLDDGTAQIRLWRSFGAPVHVEVERLFRLAPGNAAELRVEQRIRRVEASEIPVLLWQITQVEAAEEIFVDRAPLSRFAEGYRKIAFDAPAPGAMTPGPTVLHYRVGLGGHHKLGADGNWIAARRGKDLLLLQTEDGPVNGEFPDDGCRVSFYSSAEFGYSEIETQSVVLNPAPGEIHQNTVSYRLLDIPEGADIVDLLRTETESPPTSWMFRKEKSTPAATLLSVSEAGWNIQVHGEPQPQSIPAAGILGWMRSRPSPEQPFLNARVRFRNGDTLAGTLLHLDADTLRLRSAWQEELLLRVDEVEVLDLRPPQGDLVFDGTRNFDGWEYPARLSPDEAVTVLPHAGGLLVTQPVPGLIRRPFPPLPDLMRLDMTLQLPRPDTPYSAYIFSAPKTVYNSGTITLRVQEGKLFLGQRNYQNVPVEFDIPLPEGLGTRHAYELYVNHNTRRISLWLNGQALAEIDLILRDNPKEGGLWFSISTPRGQRYFLETLRVFRWNGNLPVASAPRPDNATGYRMTLANGDQLETASLTLDAESGTFSQNGPAPLTLPLRLFQRIEFPPRPAKAKTDGGFVLQLAGGSARLSGSDVSLAGDQLLLQHPAAVSPLRIPLDELDAIWTHDAEALAFPSPLHQTNKP